MASSDVRRTASSDSVSRPSTDDVARTLDDIIAKWCAKLVRELPYVTTSASINPELQKIANVIKTCAPSKSSVVMHLHSLSAKISTSSIIWGLNSKAYIISDRNDFAKLVNEILTGCNTEMLHAFDLSWRYVAGPGRPSYIRPATHTMIASIAPQTIPIPRREIKVSIAPILTTLASSTNTVPITVKLPETKNSITSTTAPVMPVTTPVMQHRSGVSVVHVLTPLMDMTHAVIHVPIVQSVQCTSHQVNSLTNFFKHYYFDFTARLSSENFFAQYSEYCNDNKMETMTVQRFGMTATQYFEHQGVPIKQLRVKASRCFYRLMRDSDTQAVAQLPVSVPASSAILSPFEPAG